MNEKFTQIPLDQDTILLFESPLKYGELDCVLQSWQYDNIRGMSLIFYAADLEPKSDDELKDWILSTSEIVQNKNKEKMTISRNATEHPYVFVNFDFQSTH